MKRIFLSIFMTVLVAVAATAASGEPLSFQTKSHDFGTVAEEGGPVSYRFKYVNKSQKAVDIRSAKTSCGCTKPKYIRKPIMPGDTGSVVVTYLPLNRPGEFLKNVTLTLRVAGQKKTEEMKLKITGVVIPENN